VSYLQAQNNLKSVVVVIVI